MRPHRKLRIDLWLTFCGTNACTQSDGPSGRSDPGVAQLTETPVTPGEVEVVADQSGKLFVEIVMRWGVPSAARSLAIN